MFSIDRPSINTSLPAIVGSYRVLHFDEVPILFTGVNRLGNRILGSLVDVDEDSSTERHFHALLDNRIYNAFIARQISYDSVLQNATSLFVIDSTFAGETISTYLLEYEDVPAAYRPAPDSFLAEAVLGAIEELTVSLHGGLADQHRGYTRNVSRLQVLWGKVLQSPFDLFESLRGVQILLEPSTVGSFRLNFDIRYSEDSLPFVSWNEYRSFAAAFLEYCLQSLPAEAKGLVSEDLNNNARYTALRDQWLPLTRQSGETVDDADARLLRALGHAATHLEEISDELGNGFDEMFLLNRALEEETVVGIVDRAYAERIGEAVELIQDRTRRIRTDRTPRKYNITVYNLNTETRKGQARVQHPSKPGLWVKARIRVGGTEPLTGTNLSDSLHQARAVEVRAVGRFVEDRLTRLYIVDEMLGIAQG